MSIAKQRKSSTSSINNDAPTISANQPSIFDSLKRKLIRKIQVKQSDNSGAAAVFLKNERMPLESQYRVENAYSGGTQIKMNGGLMQRVNSFENLTRLHNLQSLHG